MASGRIRRTAWRGLTAAVLAWVGVATFSVLMAPSAAAAASVTVAIRDLTPPVASVDQGGTVTFVNQIQDKTVRVGGSGLLPTAVNVTAKTEVTLRLPSGAKALAPGASVAERFNSTCTCAITYTYKYSSSAALTQPVIDAARTLLPALPAQTPFVVQTIVPNLPNPPTVNLPALPEVNVPAPAPAPVPTPPGGENPETTPPPEQPGANPSPSVPGGTPYSYSTGSGEQLTPSAASAAAAFDPARFASSADGSASGSGSGDSGSGGAAGSYDGASVPVFGQLAGLDSPALGEENADELASSRTGAPALPAAALAAVVALAAVTAALIRTHQAHRAAPGRHAAR